MYLNIKYIIIKTYLIFFCIFVILVLGDVDVYLPKRLSLETTSFVEMPFSLNCLPVCWRDRETGGSEERNACSL